MPINWDEVLTVLGAYLLMASAISLILFIPGVLTWYASYQRRRRTAKRRQMEITAIITVLCLEFLPRVPDESLSDPTRREHFLRSLKEAQRNELPDGYQEHEPLTELQTQIPKGGKP